MKPKAKIYLGDGAFAEVRNDGMLWLTTEDGVQTTNAVALEPDVLVSLFRYLEISL
jgi:hypothetical protein